MKSNRKKVPSVADKKIVDRQLKYIEKEHQCILVTQFSDGSILSEPKTPEEAAVLHAEIHGF